MMGKYSFFPSPSGENMDVSSKDAQVKQREELTTLMLHVRKRSNKVVRVDISERNEKEHNLSSQVQNSPHCPQIPDSKRGGGT